MSHFAHIAVPADCAIALSSLGAAHVVLVAPPGMAADLAMLTRPGNLAGAFTHDDGLTWPDDRGCAAASACLAAGCAVGLIFQDEASAVACRDRLAREIGQ